MIKWSPRLIMTGRLFRLPVGGEERPSLQADGFELVAERFSRRDRAWMHYLRGPPRGGDYEISATDGSGASSTVVVSVRSPDELRQPFTDSGTCWPRRWPVGNGWASRKRRQTLQQSVPAPVDADRLAWWTSQDDQSLWRHLPDAESPRAHYVNVHQGCPSCGTAIFAHHGFYPWQRSHAPADLRSRCPACDAVFPSNDLLTGDFCSGDFVDDGFGYFDDDGYVFLFAASSRRELVGQYSSVIRLLSDHLRRTGPNRPIARQLGLMLLRWSMEEVYVAAAPQFRHGPSQEVEQPWEGGQPDWAGMEDPIAALHRKGSLAYAIDVPHVTIALAHAYDTVWPQLSQDDEWIARARGLGLDLADTGAGLRLIEEALACLIQTAMDGAALSNKPGTSLGVLTALRALDRDDATDVMEWLYDRGPDRLRVFVTNNFTGDGMPPEATGGYNDTHTRGVFELQEQVDALRQLHPRAYPLARFPSVTDDPRLDRLVRAPFDMALLGRVPFHFGDGGSAGVQHPLSDRDALMPLNEAALESAVAAGSTAARELLGRLRRGEPGSPGTTIHDGVGIAILRTAGAPEHAAAGIVYGDAPWHRHQDLLDVQLYAFGRPFLSDLGYPQSWAHVGAWEGNWATHNSVWSVVDGVEPLDLPFDTPWHFLKEIAGRGRLVRVLRSEGVQVLDVEARRWVFDPLTMRWLDPGVRFRRLLALIETEGNGIALVDLSRIRGGDEHWRLCRGLERSFVQHGVDPKPLSGTLAGIDVERGDQGAVHHRDDLGLAWMDDVSRLAAGGRPGRWTSRHDGGAHLDLHQLHVTEGTALRSARATAVMDEPERSRYDYRALAWSRRNPGDETTAIDLLFEPHLGQPTIAEARRIGSAAGSGDAAGVYLRTRAGRELSLYWAPSHRPDEETRFNDGTRLRGALAIAESGGATTVGCDGLARESHWTNVPAARQCGSIVELNRRRCCIDVEGLTDASRGDRVCINPSGRAHSYGVTMAERLRDGRIRLFLDMASVHGRARIAAIDGDRLELDFHLVTRTSALLGTRLMRERDGVWRAITHACNRDADTTIVDVAPGDAPTPEWVTVGDWVAAVDYAVGDTVQLEPVYTLTDRGANR